MVELSRAAGHLPAGGVSVIALVTLPLASTVTSPVADRTQPRQPVGAESAVRRAAVKAVVGVTGSARTPV